jgi:hypothetical protein
MDTTHLVNIARKGRLLNTIEKYYIYKAIKWGGKAYK